jgi:hypothetical protein
MTEEVKNTEAPKAEPGADQVKPDPNNPANPANPASPDLTISDLQAIKTIIDVASSRGTFKAAEMAVVGNTYNRLTQFLDAVKPAEKEGQPEASAEAPKA